MNRILKIALAFAILFSLAAFIATAEDTAENTTKTSKQEVELEEYAVYSSLINTMYIREHSAYGVVQRDIKMIVIESTTDWKGHMSNIPDKVVESLELGKDIIDDYWARNDKPCELSQDSFKLDVKCVLLSEKEQEEIFQEKHEPGWHVGESWERFNEKFSNSQGLLTLSRAGFNRGKTRALVNVENLCGPLCGARYYVVLSKENGEWVIEKKVMSVLF